MYIIQCIVHGTRYVCLVCTPRWFVWRIHSEEDHHYRQREVERWRAGGGGRGVLGLRPPVYRGFGPPRRRTLIIVFIALGQWRGGEAACQTVCLCPTTQPQCMGYTIHPHTIPTREKVMDREMAKFDLMTRLARNWGRGRADFLKVESWTDLDVPLKGTVAWEVILIIETNLGWK